MPKAASDIMILEHGSWQSETDKLAALPAWLDANVGRANAEPALYLSGWIMDRLLEDPASKGLLAKISNAAARGEVEILGGLYYEPHAALFDEVLIEWQLNRTREIWKGCGITSINRCFIPTPCAHQSLAPLLTSAGYMECLPNERFESATTTGPRASRLVKRFQEIRKEYYAAQEALAVDGISPIAKAHLELALQYISQASHYHPFNAAESDPALRFIFRKEAFEAILRAQVEIDMALNPTVDPTVGWVSHRLQQNGAAKEDELVVDTQLSRIYIDLRADGHFTEFDYRPRKVDLCNWEAPPVTASAFLAANFDLAVEQARSAAAQKAQSSPSLRILRSAKDVLIFNLEQPLQCSLKSGSWVGKIVRSFIFRAGIGAHLPNATTGFSTEFWLEGETLPSGCALALSIPLVLPSGDSGAQIVQPLLCVGGVSPERLPLGSEQRILTKKVPGGLYGARLSDGIEDFTIDLRVAKPVHEILALPIQGGTELLFVFDASRLLGDERSNTLFLSIL